MKDYKYNIYSSASPFTGDTQKHVANFLFEHLDQYGDPLEHITSAMNYAMNEDKHQGGFILVCTEEDAIRGVVVVLKTGMGGYIPENILVYIAVHQSCRGQGVGKTLMKKAIERAEGDVALHVEPDNPAKFLYEKIGFKNKYLEMRYKK